MDPSRRNSEAQIYTIEQNRSLAFYSEKLGEVVPHHMGTNCPTAEWGLTDLLPQTS